MAGSGGAADDSFGSLLRAHREAAGLSQEALAARSGVSVETISQWERGLVKRPRRTTLKLLTDALRLEPNAVDAMWSAAQSHVTPRAATAARRRRPAIPKRLLLLTSTVAMLMASGSTWAVVSHFGTAAPPAAGPLQIADRPEDPQGVWSAFVGPGCGTFAPAQLSNHSPGSPADGWRPTSGGTPEYPCGPPVSSHQSGDPLRGQDDARWVFRPGLTVSCSFAIFIPSVDKGNWAAKAHYSVYPGELDSGYSGAQLMGFTMDQHDAGGHWVSAGPYITSTGVIELVLDDRGAGDAQSVVADVVIATCTGA
ncbi:MAG TPA: helix-turn-helix transcriptional regulator [Candidatus Dormibacteraeota bacterium]|nr:helix-turn-helix transcriptional regulator [Candidatus Dormibacteraeota bacterium]